MSDEKGEPLSEKSLLNVGQTILFRIKSKKPESVESVSLQTWNSGISHYEGITNKLSAEGNFDIPYIVPSASVQARLSFDIIVRSKAGGRQHFFINKPTDWEIKENSFLESLVELNKKLKVQGLSLDRESPVITNVVSKKKAKGALLSFDIKDSHPDLTRMRILDRPAKCFSLKKDIYRCEHYLEEGEALRNKNNIEISALDRARNLKKISIQNIYNPTASVALRGPVLVEKCAQDNLDIKLSFKDNSSLIKSIEFNKWVDQKEKQRVVASDGASLKKTKIIAKKKQDSELNLTLKGISQQSFSFSKYELLIKDKNLREFLYLLEPEESFLKKDIACDGRVLNTNLLQIKEIQE